MRIITTALVVSTAALLLAACGSSGFANRKRPDEFAVARAAPLIVPPDFALVPPRAGEPNRASPDSRNQLLQHLAEGLWGPDPSSSTSGRGSSRLWTERLRLIFVSALQVDRAVFFTASITPAGLRTAGEVADGNLAVLEAGHAQGCWVLFDTDRVRPLPREWLQVVEWPQTSIPEGAFTTATNVTFQIETKCKSTGLVTGKLYKITPTVPPPATPALMTSGARALSG